MSFIVLNTFITHSISVSKSFHFTILVLYYCRKQLLKSLRCCFGIRFINIKITSLVSDLLNLAHVSRVSNTMQSQSYLSRSQAGRNSYYSSIIFTFLI